MGMVQRTVGSFLVWCLFASMATGAGGAELSGIVKDSTGAPFKGAFVQARHSGTKITVNALSDKQGSYRIKNLAPGEYQIKAVTKGYKGERAKKLTLNDGQSASLDFTMQEGRMQWSDLSIYQHKSLLPEGEGKSTAIGTCLACHGVSTRYGRRSEQGWYSVVGYMRNAFGYFLDGRISDSQAEDAVSYLNHVFGEDSELPRYPNVRPREFNDEAMNIVYVDYELPTPKTFPWSGQPDKDGNIWIAEYNTNQLGMLDPKTAEFQEFRVPELGRADIHSVTPASDGTVWIAESSGVHKLGKFDPHTKKITEYQNPATASTRGTMVGRMHSVRVDSKGNVWTTGNPISRFDPKTEEFTIFPEARAYGLAIDKEDNAWFTDLGESILGKIDGKTGKVTKWDPPTPKAATRRIKIDDQGIIWFAEYNAGKIGRFDPQTETFKEYPLPGPSPTPYGLGIDGNNHIWYASYETDVMGRLDPQTGDVVEYPMPYVDNAIRELFLDSEGRMWYGTAGFNKVGYFTVSDGR